ncbi:NAD-dependent epimerase/dehydratase family protein [Kitasatospora purpeofusca]|uniref:NAD-dependent epimerase/dehydratase family protein n=1 Tax=Kitasatospora purpeofusca TaxID=67352 RepID=UPI002E0FF8B3|nr:NAD-dependent epimerase/dehydratase family protein [Kitasatospora purpeofusca]WSR43708.1 NAD-dependent epimerase/dehydratase family protein [Kitasatospora purpeofusca]
MARHIVIGKGPVGATTARLLDQQGHEVVVLSRSGGDGSTALDVTDTASLRQATKGADVIYNCANPPYHRWPTDWPPIANALLDAAESAGSVLVTMGNLYGYGPVDTPMTEDLPLAGTGPKARVRIGMWRDALARHRAGRIRVAEARASDFFGPGVTEAGHLAQRMMPALLAGRAVRLIGNPDAPHSFTYIPDIARALVRLGTDERAWGRAWHVPTAPPLSTREAVRHLCRLAGLPPTKVGRIPWWPLHLAGLVDPMLGELREVQYQFDRPFVLDSHTYTATFGEMSTPIDEALGATVEWWRARLGR